MPVMGAMAETTNATWCEPGGVRMRCRRRPTLPRPLGRSTIGAAGLNGRVRDGNGCGPCALVASDCHCGVIAPPRRGDRRARRRSRWAKMRSEDRECVVLRALRLDYPRELGSSQAARAIRTAALGAPRGASTGGLSTSSSPTALQGAQGSGRVHLGGGFPLRCVQRLSAPTIATRRCPWQGSRDTSGSSDSVLSY